MQYQLIRELIAMNICEYNIIVTFINTAGLTCRGCDYGLVMLFDRRVSWRSFLIWDRALRPAAIAYEDSSATESQEQPTLIACVVSVLRATCLHNMLLWKANWVVRMTDPFTLGSLDLYDPISSTQSQIWIFPGSGLDMPICYLKHS